MRKVVKKLVTGLLVGTLTVGLLSGCGNSKSKETKDTATKTTADSMTIAVTSFADTLEPTEQYFSWVVTRYGVGETLVKFDGNGELTECLADSWEKSEDGLSWTFAIRENVKFSNGDDMTPEMVKASLEEPLRRVIGQFLSLNRSPSKWMDRMW